MKHLRLARKFTFTGGRPFYLLLSLLLGWSFAEAAENNFDHCAQSLMNGVPTAYEMAFDTQLGRETYLLFLRTRAYHMDRPEYITDSLAKAKSLRAVVRSWSKELAMRRYLTSPESLVVRANLSKKTSRAIARHHQIFYRAYLLELAKRLRELTTLPWAVEKIVWNAQLGEAVVLKITKHHPWAAATLDDLMKRPGPGQMIAAVVAEVYRQWQMEVVPGNQTLSLVYGDPEVIAMAKEDLFWRPPKLAEQATGQDERIFLPWYIFDEGMPALSSLYEAVWKYLAQHR